MTAQEYIESLFTRITLPSEVEKPASRAELTHVLYRLLTTKKFRKYTLNDEYVAHIQKSIAASVAANEPIKIVFFGGCYKLWRLEESPEADWAKYLHTCTSHSG
ncbi:hypothetical protein IPL68_02245 [Candidatus Saccharibacteria bacterium]|nr:MAG: hypothetical protein IPL68_02245 [Candidatus Saccharibacteria bacterium]